MLCMRQRVAAAAVGMLWSMGVGAGVGQTAKGWRELFDGKSLEGWKHVGSGSFAVKDGLLVSTGGMGLLYSTDGPMGHCLLRVVYRMRDEDDNSGVFIRIPTEPTEAWMPVNKGFEVQIHNRDTEWRRTGTLYTFTKAMASPGRAGPLWNTMEITLDGPRTTVAVNGITVTDFTQTPEFTPPARVGGEPAVGARSEVGWVGVQNHSDKDVVMFKEIAVRPLP